MSAEAPITRLEAIHVLRVTIAKLIPAIETLGGVAAREHSSFEETRDHALDRAYSALRLTNKIKGGIS